MVRFEHEDYDYFNEFPPYAPYAPYGPVSESEYEDFLAEFGDDDYLEGIASANEYTGLIPSGEEV